ncbi:MAG TPA: short-chain dehydrogenase, partial [Methylocystis sp.]
MSGAEGLGPVLVTGAARRIGLALAEGFARDGRPVILHASPRSLPAAAAAA